MAKPPPTFATRWGTPASRSRSTPTAICFRAEARKRATATRRRWRRRGRNPKRMFAKRSQLRVKRREVAMQPIEKVWLRGKDLNLRPLGYEPNELPDCSTPHPYNTVSNGLGQTAQTCGNVCTCSKPRIHEDQSQHRWARWPVQLSYSYRKARIGSTL